MQRILSFCFGWSVGKQKFEKSLTNGERFSSANSTERAQEDLSTPHLPLPKKGDLANPLPFVQEGEPSNAPSPPKKESPSNPLILGERGSPASPCPCWKGQSQRPAAGALPPSDSKSAVGSPCTGNRDDLAQPPEEGSIFEDNINASSEELRPDGAQVPPEDSVLNQLLLCRCGRVSPHKLFLSGDVSQAVTRKSKSSSAVAREPGKPESSCVVSCEEAPGDINETYWQCYRAMLPVHSSLESVRKHEDKKRQLATTQSYFEKGAPANNTKGELLQEGMQVGTDGRKNVRTNRDTDAVQLSYVPGVYVCPFPVDGEVTRSENAINHPLLSSSCLTAARQTPGSESDCYNCFKPKLETPESYRSADRGSMVNPCLRNRSWCKCSQEILLHRLEEGANCKGRRGTLSKRNIPDILQDISQNHHC
ncbi:uncharacterized protein [Struthio camelus]|uniref:uncharacterized protein isoform X2 n=1 Tax=Struthio camelus TaxID=8801 RepID=UPI003603BA2C